MSQETIRIFEEPREETFLSRIWERWAEVLIIPLILIALFGFRNWYGKKEQADADRLHGRLANMHRTVTQHVYHDGLATPAGWFVAPFPYGLYVQSEEDRDEWTIKLPMETKAHTGERKLSMAIAKIRNHEKIGGYELMSLEAITPAGRDLELTEKKLKESRSGKLWYVIPPPTW